jgi:bacillopeptidase F (M6 metalloprotease family)
MVTVEATRSPNVSVTEFRELLDEALSELDTDEKTGPLLRAAGLRMRFDFPDLGMVLNVATSEEPGHHLRWEFSDAVDWEPKLTFSMDSQIANAYLQGKESLAIAIARGRVRYKGDTQCALLYVPALRLVVGPYRRLVRREYPHLLV